MQLYLCEKPSQARDIARVLDARNRSDGYLHNATAGLHPQRPAAGLLKTVGHGRTGGTGYRPAPV